MWGVGLAPRACAVVLPRGSVCLLGETDKLLAMNMITLTTHENDSIFKACI